MKFNPDHKPGPAASLPDGFSIKGAIRSGRTVFRGGDEAAYAATKPSKADVERLVEREVIALPDAKASTEKASK